MSHDQLKSATQLPNLLLYTHHIYLQFLFFFLQDRGLDFGLTVLPCSTPPGVKIFGSAPQFNAKNFSHVFVHGSDYEIPGKTCFCYILRKKKMVFCYQNCSALLWGKIVLVIEKNFWNSRLKIKNLQNFWDY